MQLLTRTVLCCCCCCADQVLQEIHGQVSSGVKPLQAVEAVTAQRMGPQVCMSMHACVTHAYSCTRMHCCQPHVAPAGPICQSQASYMHVQEPVSTSHANALQTRCRPMIEIPLVHPICCPPGCCRRDQAAGGSVPGLFCWRGCGAGNQGPAVPAGLSPCPRVRRALLLANLQHLQRPVTCCCSL